MVLPNEHTYNNLRPDLTKPLLILVIFDVVFTLRHAAHVRPYLLSDQWIFWATTIYRYTDLNRNHGIYNNVVLFLDN